LQDIQISITKHAITRFESGFHDDAKVMAKMMCMLLFPHVGAFEASEQMVENVAVEEPNQCAEFGCSCSSKMCIDFVGQEVH
jgi:hypothetical protein